MATQKPANPDTSYFTSLIEGAKRYIMGILKRTLEQKIKQLEELGMKIALGLVLFVVSVFFILTSIVFYLYEARAWSLSQGFFVIGLITLAGCVIVYLLLHPKK